MRDNRLGDMRASDFSRPLIDRTHPLTFRLNGMQIAGFAGDNVLSALLASGINTVGMQNGFPVALDDATAPPVALRGNEHRPDLAMPMPLCSPLDGLDLVTLGPRTASTPLGRFLRSLSGPAQSLDHDLDKGLALPGSWIAAEAAQQHKADIVIVGAGVAGLSAALQATGRKARVILIEQGPVVGGLSGFFGKAEGEPAPDATIAELASAAENHERITLFTHTEAFDIANGAVEAVQVIVDGGIPRPVRLRLTGKHILLATGSTERLPIFPGNRLPGVVSASAAWRMAALFNVWPGADAHVHTATNAGYRMTMLGHDSGRTVARASDPRLAPQTRFIEFSKAYGVRLGWGAIVASVGREKGTPRLVIRHRNSEGGSLQDGVVTADRLIVSGGWQPDIALWLRAGGAVHWDSERQRAIPIGDTSNVAMIGSAAGFTSLSGCMDSGTAMAEWLLRGKKIAIEDRQIDTMFESPDGILGLSILPESGAAPAYHGPVGLSTLPRQKTSRAFDFARRTLAAASPPQTAISPRDLPGLVLSGVLEPEAVQAFCAERCILPLGFHAAPLPAVSEPAADLPPWLASRFGPRQVRWHVILADGRSAAPGCLIHANTDATNPLDAIGVMVDATGHALLINRRWKSGDIVYVRDGLTCTPARLDSTIQ